MSAKRCAGNEPVSSNILRIIQEKGYKQCAVAKKAGYTADEIAMRKAADLPVD